MAPQVPQQSKEQVAYMIVDWAIREKWIEPKTYDEFLEAVVKAIAALNGVLRRGKLPIED